MAQKNYMWTIMRRRSGLYDEDVDKVSGVWVYSAFEKARADLRRILREVALSDRELFDRDGNMLDFRDYLEKVTEADSQTGDELMELLVLSHGGDSYDPELLRSIPDRLRDYLLGKTDDPFSGITEFSWEDRNLSIEADEESLVVYSKAYRGDDAPDLTIEIRNFALDGLQEGHCFYFRRKCDDEESFYYLDLLKVEVDEPLEF